MAWTPGIAGGFSWFPKCIPFCCNSKNRCLFERTAKKMLGILSFGGQHGLGSHGSVEKLEHLHGSGFGACGPRGFYGGSLTGGSGKNGHSEISF